MSQSAQNRDRKGADAHVYLITFACYGSHLPGQVGAVDRNHNLYHGRLAEPNPGIEASARRRMHHQCYLLDAGRREMVLDAIIESCYERKRPLYAAHVRTNHVHAVISSDRIPEHIMNTLKSNASGVLNRSGLDASDCSRWTRHGSTRYLWTHEQISAAIHYVICEQGDPVAVYEAPCVALASAP